jgi:glycosyltransferase involved in cell wall biosynthesis
VVAAEGGALISTRPARRRVIHLVERFLAPLTSAYVANSAATAAELRRLGAPADRIEIVPNGVVAPPTLDAATRDRLRREVGASETAPLAVMVARLDGEFKDHDTFVRAVREVPGLRAAVVGDGPGREATEAAARDLAVADRVVFTGFRPDAARLAAAADVSVLLTYSEGLSNVVLESMAAGVPVVATDIPGNREAIRHGVDGVLVPVGDVGATAAALARLAADGEERRRLGDAARRHVLERFSSTAQAERTMALYDRLLADKRR